MSGNRPDSSLVERASVSGLINTRAKRPLWAKFFPGAFSRAERPTAPAETDFRASKAPDDAARACSGAVSTQSGSPRAEAARGEPPPDARRLRRAPPRFPAGPRRVRRRHAPPARPRTRSGRVSGRPGCRERVPLRPFVTTPRGRGARGSARRLAALWRACSAAVPGARPTRRLVVTALAGLAALSFAVPALAQDPVWSTTLTVGHETHRFGYYTEGGLHPGLVLDRLGVAGRRQLRLRHARRDLYGEEPPLVYQQWESVLRPRRGAAGGGHADADPEHRRRAVRAGGRAPDRNQEVHLGG